MVVDCTLGRGGHAALLLPRLAPGGTLLGLDTDPANAAYARQRLGPIAARHGVRLIVEHANFAALPAVLADHDLPPGRRAAGGPGLCEQPDGRTRRGG